MAFSNIVWGFFMSSNRRFRQRVADSLACALLFDAFRLHSNFWTAFRERTAMPQPFARARGFLSRIARACGNRCVPFQRLLRIFWAVSWSGLLSSYAFASDAQVVGAGASFPAPALEGWAKAFARDSGSAPLYRSVGSGEGVRRLTARSADFAMTDVPLTQTELSQDDLMQFPVVAGAVVPVVNLPGVRDGELKITGSVLSDIFFGRITNWNATALQELNPEKRLPDLPIRVVHRADGSGTTFVFTYYLSRVNPQWRERLGIASRLHWPAGVGANGNQGVSQAVRNTVGAIGYVEYSYAVQYDLATAQLRNKAGKFARVSDAGLHAALSSARWSRPGFYEILVDKEGDESWPIVGVSFALIHKSPERRGEAAATLRFLHWIYAHGAPVARELHYAPLEDAALIGRIESSWTQVRDDAGKSIWTGAH